MRAKHCGFERSRSNATEEVCVSTKMLAPNLRKGGRGGGKGGRREEGGGREGEKKGPETSHKMIMAPRCRLPIELQIS